MRRGTRRKHGTHPWLTVSVEKRNYSIYRFRSLADCKAHVLKHVLGLQYADSRWTTEGWFRLFGRDAREGEIARASLAETDCPAWQDRAKSRLGDTKYSFLPICQRCAEEGGHRCGSILSGLTEDYQRTIIGTLRNAYNVPRYGLQIERAKDNKEQLSTYWLNNTGVLVVATGSECTESAMNEVNVVSSYRSGPETVRRQSSDDHIWTDAECLQYGKAHCRHKRRKAESIIALKTSESWDEQSNTAPVWASLNDRARNALQALRQSLAEGEELRRSQGSG